MTIETWLMISLAITTVIANIALSGLHSAQNERDVYKDIAEMWRKQWEKDKK